MIITSDNISQHKGILPIISGIDLTFPLDMFDQYEIVSDGWLEMQHGDAYGIWVSYNVQCFERLIKMSIPLFLFSSVPIVKVKWNKEPSINITNEISTFVYPFFNKMDSENVEEYKFITNDMIFFNKYIFGKLWTDVMSSIGVEYTIRKC